MALLHYYVHGRGRGHASRSRAVIARLQQAGHEVIAFAGRDARALLRDRVPTRSVRSLLPGQGLGTGPLVAARVREAAAALRHDDARLVISDGDLPGLLAARLLRRPSIAVGHGLVFLCCERPPSLPAAPWRREAIKAGVSSVGASRRVAVGFVPLPVRRGRLARPALELPEIRRTPDGPVLCYFRDGASVPLQRHLAALSRDVPVILFARRHVAHDPESPWQTGLLLAAVLLVTFAPRRWLGAAEPPLRLCRAGLSRRPDLGGLVRWSEIGSLGRLEDDRGARVAWAGPDGAPVGLPERPSVPAEDLLTLMERLLKDARS